jgi:glutaredoxin-like protein NrdH
MAEFTKVEGRNLGDIRMFTLSTCGWCKKTKAFFRDHNVAFSYIDVDLLSFGEQDKILEQQRVYDPTESYPTIVVNSDYCIVGYDENKLKQLLGENND